MTFINHKAVCKTRPPKTSRIPKRLKKHIDINYMDLGFGRLNPHFSPITLELINKSNSNNRRNRRARLFAK